MDDLENLIIRTVERWMASRYTERHGLVTSYDPVNYLAKVTYQPEGQESGWLPIETGHIGEGYGIAIGLQPGSGGQSGGASGASSGSTAGLGDQVVVRFQEGDFESGKIVQRVHSVQDTPPPVQSGEIVIWTKFKQDSNAGPDAATAGAQGSQGQKIYFKNDGSLTVTDGNGATVFLDGNAIVTCKTVTTKATAGNITETATGDIDETATGNINENASGNIGESAGNNISQSAGNEINLNAGDDINLNAAEAVLIQGGGMVMPPLTIPQG